MKIGESLHPNCVTQGSGGNVHLWGAIRWDGPGPLIILRESVNGLKYFELLNNTVFTVLTARFPDSDDEYQDDNSPSHHHHLARDWYEDNSGLFYRHVWPARSTNLSFIENLWDVLDRAIRRDLQKKKLSSLGQKLLEKHAVILLNLLLED